MSKDYSSELIENFYDACIEDSDCDDHDLCTENACEAGVCKFTEISCNDGDSADNNPFEAALGSGESKSDGSVDVMPA